MDGTEKLQFIPLKTIKVQHDSIVHFALHAYDNDVIIKCPCKESLILSMINEPDITGKIPYSIQSIDVPRDRQLTSLIRGVDLRSIYGKLKVLERQEIGLDPIIVGDASLEPAKPSILQAHLSPVTTVKSKKLIAITTYGECLILEKAKGATKRWDHVVCNVTKFLIHELYPMKKSAVANITQYADLKAFLEGCTCTACTWHDNGEIIYVATAAGSLYVFKFDDNAGILELNFQLLTNIGRVSYLKAFDNFVIAASSNGIISLYTLLPNAEGSGSVLLVEHGLLWTDADELGCTQLIVQHNQTPNGGYAIVCAKAAFVIVFLLSRHGNLLGIANTRIADIKVTGIALFAENDYIVTTIRGKIFRVRFNYAVKGDVALELALKSEELIAPSDDGQIDAMYGVGTTTNKVLWFFLMNDARSKGSRETTRYSALMICKPSTLNPLTMLNTLEYETIDPYLDIIWSFRMDIRLLEAGGQYAAYMPLNADMELPEIMDRDFLRKLQIRLEIGNVRARFASYELKTFNETYIEEVEFLRSAIQIVHILLRLQFLRQQLEASSTDGLSVFQQKAAFFMHKAFRHLLEKLTYFSPIADKNERNSVLNNLKIKLVELAWRQMTAMCLPTPKCVFEDVCFVCNGMMDDHTFTCPNCVNSYRCSVSFVPVPIFCRLQCTQCSVLAYDDEHNSNILSELFSRYEAVKCIFCCASFVE